MTDDPAEAPSNAACIHRWALATAGEGGALGACRLCHSVRIFTDARKTRPHTGAASGARSATIGEGSRDGTAHRSDRGGVPSEALGPRGRILLIDDSSDIEDMLRMILEEQGYTVVVSHSPAEARPILEAIAFDLVITDGFSRLPQDIIANTAAVLTAAGATPVALFTGRRIERDAAQAAGFRDLIPKPFDLETLGRQVRTLLNPGTLPLDRNTPPAASVVAAEMERTHG